MHRTQVLDHRDQDVHVRPRHELQVCTVRQGWESECVRLLLLLVCDVRTDLRPVFSVLTRPYVMGKHKEGSQCPLLVTPYVRETQT